MDNTSDHRARLVVVERGLEELKGTVNDLAKNINRWISDQANAPRPIPFKEIVVTAGATLAMFYGILQFLDSRSAPHIDALKFRMEKAEKDLERLAPLKYMQLLSPVPPR